MKTIVLWLISVIITALEAEIKIPNGHFDNFSTINKNGFSYELPKYWKEHRKNKKQRIEDGQGCAYKYAMPDANHNAIGLYRGFSNSHIVKSNSIFTSFLLGEDHDKLRLRGRYKFSGSDIEHVKDTLRIIAYSSVKRVDSIPAKLPKSSKVLNIAMPVSQFQWFHLDIDRIQKNNYLTLVLEVVSGSDDNFYYGYANAIIDDLELIRHNKFSK